MTLQHFTTFEEAERILWQEVCDSSYWKRLARLWKFSDRLLMRKYPHGLFRYRTMEEGQREAEKWIASNASLKF